MSREAGKLRAKRFELAAGGRHVAAAVIEPRQQRLPINFQDCGGDDGGVVEGVLVIAHHPAGAVLWAGLRALDGDAINPVPWLLISNPAPWPMPVTVSAKVAPR